jgi:hypothetical protein
MRQVYAVRPASAQHLVSLRSRSMHYVHIEFAGLAGKPFKFQKLKLHAIRRIF